MSNKRFGIKEVADVTFYELDKWGYPGNPVICLDTLKVSNIEQTADQTDARGGKGSSPLIIWDHNKEITLTLQDAVLSNKTLEIMYGDQKSGVVTISASTFPKTYYIEGSTFARDLKTGKDQIFKFIIPKAKVVSENTITMEAEGDPTVFDIKLRALRDTDGNMLKLILVPEESQGLAYEEYEGGYKVTGIGTCKDTDVVIPNSYNGKPVVAIGAEAFMDSSMVSVTIPSNVVEIEIDAFNSCLALETINMAEGLKTIGEYAFVACSSLKKVVIPNSVVNIKDGAFASCSSLKTATFGSNISYIGFEVFSETSLEDVYYKGSFGQISKSTIEREYNDNLFNATWHCNDMQAEGIGFSGDCVWTKKGTQLIIAGSGDGRMEDYDDNRDCPWDSVEYDQVIIQDGVTYIGNNTFVLRPISSVFFGSDVAEINPDAFFMNQINSYDVSANNLNYCAVDGVIFSKDKTTLVRYPDGRKAYYPIPDGVTTIENSAFKFSVRTSVKIPNTVTTIKERAFAYRGADSLVIPASVTFIGENAFTGDPDATTVYVCKPENSISGAPWGAKKVVWDYTPS